MTDEEFKTEQMKLFDEASLCRGVTTIDRFFAMRLMLHLIFGFLVNLTIQLKHLRDDLAQVRSIATEKPNDRSRIND